jgi:two-component system OmpR family sensor kinase
MRSLFLRIFLSFWAAMLLMLSATAAVAWYRFNRDQAITLDSQALADEASQRLLAGGVSAMHDWVEEVERRYPGRRIYVVDASGGDIFERELPRNYRAYAERLRSAGYLARDPVTRRDDPLLLTPLFEGRDGSVYTLMLGSNWPLWPLHSPDVRFVVLAFALTISGLLCWWLAWHVSKPLERLKESARSLAKGNLEARVGAEFSRRRDELGALARDFDTMADHVRNLIASKEDLLRGMSHELRSPLARLRVAAGLARRPAADVGRQLDRIELEAERLDMLIGQMLQLSALRAVEPTLPRESIELTSLLSDIVEDARLEAGAADKRVEWQPGASLLLDGDHSLIRSAIENVIRNSVRFTPADSAVAVTVAREDARALIVIEDRGPGVPEAELDRIFEPFYRVAESRDRDSGGTGLGLAITARIVRLYGGNVRALNRLDGGLRVEVRLPAVLQETALLSDSRAREPISAPERDYAGAVRVRGSP